MATTKETFDTALAALKSANPERADLHKACNELAQMLGYEAMRLQGEEREDLDSFIADNKATWDSHVAARGTARETLKPKK